ncbi:sensor histidine kinase [Nonomuraea typhae]|uniref:Sensor histidine kinase n=1 Tax=Nonomuraea typhae TaxID=2603600 RepID=A0ABW7ZBT4_9ACTN
MKGTDDFHRGRSAARAGTAAWLLVTVWPLWVLVASGPSPLRVVAALAVLTVLCWSWLATMWRFIGPGAGSPRPWAVTVLVVAATALLPLLGPAWAYVAFVFVITALATVLWRAAFAAGAVATAAVSTAVVLADGQNAWWLPPVVLALALAVNATKQMGVLIWRLDTARAQVATLAVDNERLRFARDLHDTLGHTLTSITIRSQLAARLARTDPERAAGEMAGVEATARQALDEVRHAVAGYRTPELSAELEKAAHTMKLAGIAVSVSPAGGPIPWAAETLLAWAVREAATNVVRHSRAGQCRITLGVDDGWASLDVCDDGCAVPDAVSEGKVSEGKVSAGKGNGLRGLAERVRAAGGVLEAGARPEGGYRLRARVPLEAP